MLFNSYANSNQNKRKEYSLDSINRALSHKILYHDCLNMNTPNFAVIYRVFWLTGQHYYSEKKSIYIYIFTLFKYIHICRGICRGVVGSPLAYKTESPGQTSSTK